MLCRLAARAEKLTCRRLTLRRTATGWQFGSGGCTSASTTACASSRRRRSPCWCRRRRWCGAAAQGCPAPEPGKEETLHCRCQSPPASGAADSRFSIPVQGCRSSPGPQEPHPPERNGPSPSVWGLLPAGVCLLQLGESRREGRAERACASSPSRIKEWRSDAGGASPAE